MSLDRPTVFVVVDDALVCSAIQDMLKSVGVYAETFATPREFLDRKVAGPELVKIQRRQVMHKMKAESLAELVALSAKLDIHPRKS